MIQYVLECIAFQLVFIIIYDLFLKRETFFQWNRVYLIGTYMLSMIIPWVKIEAMKTAMPEVFQGYPEYLWGLNNATVAVKELNQSTLTVSWEYLFLFGGMLLATLFFGYKLYQIVELKKSSNKQIFKDFTQYVIANSGAAFSFFKAIFLGDKVLEKEHQSIVQHELVHIRQKHTYDLLFFELMRIVGWFNPLVYVYQSRVSELHEFIADAHVAKTHKKEQYQLLLSEVFQTQHISFINQFFKSSLIKKRIVMLQKAKSKRVFQLKYLFLIPIIAGMLFYTSCQSSSQEMDTIFVEDVSNLSPKEEKEVFEKLFQLSGSSDDWKLFVKDDNSSMKFIKSENGSYLSGPNGEKIHAKLAIDSKLSDSEMDLFTAFLGEKSGGELNLKNAVEKYNLLVNERQRLLKSANEKNPIIVNLDQQINALKKSFEGTIGQSVNQDSDIAFALVDEAPVFPDCENEEDTKECFKKMIFRHISKNFNYPKEAQEKGLEGQVNTMFTIAVDGTIKNIKLRGPHELLENEVNRIIERLPKMKPGIHHGVKVNVPFSIPVTFKLDDNDSQ